MMSAATIQSYIKPGSTLIVGFSGGPDSVCLLTLLSQLQSQLNLTIIAAHLDHQWRQESAMDAQWCQQFCAQLTNITYIVKKAEELNISIKKNGSQEEIGRILRRAFFKQLAQQYQAKYIVLAHHNDDQLETFFIRLLRGSSLTGLAGIKQFDGLFLRPLLHVSKNEILKFLNDNNITYLTDASNLDQKFLRNKIRHQLIPQLTNIDQRFNKNLTACMDNLRKTDDFLETLTQETVATIRDKVNPDLFNLDHFLALHEILQYRILLHLCVAYKITVNPSSGFFHEIITFLRNSKHQQHQLGLHFAIIKHNKTKQFSFKSL